MPQIRATRRTQPLRKKVGRQQTRSLTAARRGRTFQGFNPQDAKRMAAKSYGRRARRLARKPPRRQVRRQGRTKPLRFLSR